MVSRLKNNTYLNFIKRDKLRGMMAEKNLSYQKVADYLQITRTALTNKINKRTDFTEHEIVLLYRLFGANLFLDNVFANNLHYE